MQLTSIIFEEGSQLKVIGYEAFSCCVNVQNIDIPSGVTTIANSAFYNVPHITYNGTATGSPWGAKAIN